MRATSWRAIGGGCRSTSEAATPEVRDPQTKFAVDVAYANDVAGTAFATKTFFLQPLNSVTVSVGNNR